ncbi:hypothetical protein [Dactylosporangium sp. CA-139066]|uniref:hypothetical protein n=1 Tax=Dactylosporangium sp. CA-139066 TaxID=3239930 RepID=UPI003D8CEA65
MAEPGFAELLAGDPAPFSAVARAWKQLAGELDGAAEDVIRGTRDLPEAWPEGEAAEAAARRTGEVRVEVSNTCLPAGASARRCSITPTPCTTCAGRPATCTTTRCAPGSSSVACPGYYGPGVPRTTLVGDHLAKVLDLIGPGARRAQPADVTDVPCGDGAGAPEDRFGIGTPPASR